METLAKDMRRLIRNAKVRDTIEALVKSNESEKSVKITQHGRPETIIISRVTSDDDFPEDDADEQEG